MKFRLFSKKSTSVMNFNAFRDFAYFIFLFCKFLNLSRVYVYNNLLMMQIIVFITYIELYVLFFTLNFMSSTSKFVKI